MHSNIHIRGYSYRFMHNKIASIFIEMCKRRMKILLREARTLWIVNYFQIAVCLLGEYVKNQSASY